MDGQCNSAVFRSRESRCEGSFGGNRVAFFFFFHGWVGSRYSVGWHKYLSHSINGRFAVCECNKCITTICARHRIHHQSEIPNGATVLEQRYELVFEHILGYFSTEHFAAIARHIAFPIGRRAAIFTLSYVENRDS